MSKKDAYKEKLKAQLDEWDAKIDVLKAKANKAEASAKSDYQETVEDLKKKRSKAEEQLNKLQNASEDAWKDMKNGMEQAWSELGDAIDTAMSNFK